MGPIPASHASERCACEIGHAEASRRRITFRLNAATRGTTSLIRSWASNLAPRQRMCAAASRTGAKAVTSQPLSRISAARWQRLAGRPPASVRPDARDLRASGEQRRVRHVPVPGRRTCCPMGPSREGRAERQAPGPRLHRRDAGLGRQRQRASAATTRYFPIQCVRSRESEANGTESSGCVTALSEYDEELTVLPTRTVTIQRFGLVRPDRRPRRGRLRRPPINAPTMIRFGEMTQDELFVGGARRGRVSHRQPQRQRSAGDSEALRPWQSGQRAATATAPALIPRRRS